MGLFGNLFEKKTCAICGEEIGLLGNRKLEDGNCCKKCASKLSPFFNERRHSTVEEIKRQIAYREANEADVRAFRVTRTLKSEFDTVLLDEDDGWFIVTRDEDWREKNPDVLRLDQVTGCDLHVEEERDEVTYESDEQTCHYHPPRYHYYYDFTVNIYLDFAFFDEIEVKLNRYHAIEVKPFDANKSKIRKFLEADGSPNAPTMEEKRNDSKYADVERLGQEIREALLSAKNQEPDDVPSPTEEAELPSEDRAGAQVTCPWCGSKTTPNEKGQCEYCGGDVRA